MTAALANLTFMSSHTAPSLQRCNTARTLVRAVRASQGGSTLFARDQVVTVLANMAASPSCRPDLRAVDGVAFLIGMMESRGQGQAEAAAAERVQKKAAIALSR